MNARRMRTNFSRCSSSITGPTGDTRSARMPFQGGWLILLEEAMSIHHLVPGALVCYLRIIRASLLPLESFPYFLRWRFSKFDQLKNRSCSPSMRSTSTEDLPTTSGRHFERITSWVNTRRYEGARDERKKREMSSVLDSGFPFLKHTRFLGVLGEAGDFCEFGFAVWGARGGFLAPRPLHLTFSFHSWQTLIRVSLAP